MANTTKLPAVVDMKLELVPIPVSDVDRAKAFYEKVGFGDLHDTQVTDTMRVVQFTPPGSACAIVFGTGMSGISDMKPGSIKGIHLVWRTSTRLATPSANEGSPWATFPTSAG